MTILSRYKTSGSSYPNTYKRPDPVIEELTFSNEDKEYISAMIEGRPTPNVIKYWERAGHNVEHRLKWYRAPRLQERMRTVSQKYKIGLCHICQEFPVYKVLYKLPDITLVEYFCEKHFDKITT
jgi:hypothetical protein